MTDIKVGQVWIQHIYEDLFVIYVITIAGSYNNAGIGITNEGLPFSADDLKFKNSELLAEYPTWQEAVASPEFNNKTRK